jgi:hypothetical protein
MALDLEHPAKNRSNEHVPLVAKNFFVIENARVEGLPPMFLSK